MDFHWHWLAQLMEMISAEAVAPDSPTRRLLSTRLCNDPLDSIASSKEQCRAKYFGLLSNLLWWNLCANGCSFEWVAFDRKAFDRKSTGLYSSWQRVGNLNEILAWRSDTRIISQWNNVLVHVHDAKNEGIGNLDRVSSRACACSILLAIAVINYNILVHDAI